jgi:cell division protein FtsB
MTKKEPNDLEQQIENLNAVKVTLYAEVKKYREENEALQKQKIYLQKQCRTAGETISGLHKNIDRLDEENENLKTMLNA